MVILIGGVGCTGKTAMAQKLLEMYKIPYMSIDHLKMGLFRGTTDCGFTPEDDSTFIAEQIWPILKATIMTIIENKQHLIIEGCYLLPCKIMELGDEYTGEIISFYIGFSRSYIETNYVSGIIEHCSTIEARDGDDVDSTNQLVSKHLEQKEICAAHGAKFFEINENYLGEMEYIYKWIDVEVKKRRK